MFTSCSDDDVTGLSTIDYSPVSVTLTSSDNDITLDETTIGENGYVITVTATIDNPLPIDIIVPLTQTGGTATAEDFSLGSIRIPSSLTSASTEVIINKTGNIEGNETLSIGAVDNSMITNASVNDFTLNVNIENDYVIYDAEFTFDWSGSVFSSEDGSETFLEFCDMDIDIYLLDDAFAFVTQDGATGACPESFTINPSLLADGTYKVYADLYCNPYAGGPDDIVVPVPITGSYTHGYESELGSGEFTPSFQFSTDSDSGPCAGAPDFSGAGGMLADIVISGGVMTVTAL
jgi:hypothetical protein